MIPIDTIVTIIKYSDTDYQYVQICNLPHLPKVGEEFLFCSVRDEAGNYPASIDKKKYLKNFSGIVTKITHYLEKIGTDITNVKFCHHIEIILHGN